LQERLRSCLCFRSVTAIRDSFLKEASLEGDYIRKAAENREYSRGSLKGKDAQKLLLFPGCIVPL
jgi:hypothetical protein